ncbi:hypothetical protein MMC16_006939 [Acarospora aff. strigata]|nr:hypothetical protein [Acarospora aff. strigata]
MAHTPPNSNPNNPQNPLDNPRTTTMSLSALTPYSSYNINILCGPYPNPFFVHFFLGDIPKYIDYEDPYDIPSWAGQGSIYPNKPQRPISTSTTAPAQTQASTSHYIRDISDEESSTALEPRAGEEDIARPLPSSYFKNGVRSSQPLTSELVKRLNVSGPAELQAETVRGYLQRNLQWRLVGAGVPDRHRIGVDRVPIRMWVVRQNVTPPADLTQFPVYGAQEVVWDATRGKLGGLHRGELPGVG